MSYVMLPNSSQAMPKPTAEQATSGQKTEQTSGWNRHVEIPPDEAGAEMTKEARVWKTYVTETDRWDREMVDERNNSLDVLLIFAALFSAVSTAFIIESLGDLKPDPAESSAKTLLIMSQTLSAIAAGQSIFPQQSDSDSEIFSPPHSAIVVNVLWLLSLSLSVAVSLIAILAKGWCYKFMSGRSGQIYEQARRRQQKWNGIERWKMQEVLMHLPGAMHLALLLFAVGLCIYLWNINVSVAAPVAALTAIATCFYAITTVLPVLDRFCPYNTPATALLTPLSKLWEKWPIARTKLYYATRLRYYKASSRSLWKVVLRYIVNWLRPRDISPSASRLNNQDTVAPMDTVTSQILAWMIANCEDPRLLDIALQAIAGAGPTLPHAHFVQCQALEHIYQRLTACTQLDRSSEQYQMKDMTVLPIALRYIRAFCVLMSGDAYGCYADSWRPEVNDNSDSYRRAQLTSKVVHMNMEHSLDMPTEHDMFAAALSAPMPFLHWNWDGVDTAAPGGLTSVVEKLTATLRQHIDAQNLLLSPLVLLRLLESSVHHLIVRWSKDEQRRQGSLPVLLVYLFLTSRHTAPDIARAIAIILTATAFAVDPYPGGEHSPQAADGRQRRAIQVLRYYRANEPDNNTVDKLFTFGLVGLLPHIDLGLLGTWTAAIPDLSSSVIRCHFLFSHKNLFPYKIHTLPDTFSFNEHVASSAGHYLRLIPAAVRTLDEERTMTLSVLSIVPKASFRMRDKMILPALVALRHAQSKQLRDLTLDALGYMLPRIVSFSHVLEQMEDKDLLGNMFSDLSPMVSYSTSYAMFYFRLLVANIMLSSQNPLNDRQSALRNMIHCRDEFTRLTPSNTDRALPSKEYILSHVTSVSNSEPDLQCMLHTMQLVVDFCHADPSLNAGSRENADDKGWMNDLGKIHQKFLSDIRQTEDPSLVQIESSTPPAPNTTLGESSAINEATD